MHRRLIGRQRFRRLEMLQRLLEVLRLAEQVRVADVEMHGEEFRRERQRFLVGRPVVRLPVQAALNAGENE